MKQALLFEIPRTHPSRKERIRDFKKVHGIETHYAGKGWAKKDNPWSACLMPKARQVGYGVTEQSSLADCVAHACRLLEEAGLLVTGETELMAIRALCQENQIPCDL